jgi:hypothetical protein
MQREALGLAPSQVKTINRALIEAGLITMKDSPNGKRYGVRDRAGRITEAYGFDLSPIAARHAEFVRLAEEARAERAAMGRLRRRATIARNGITQILETAAEYGFQGEEWTSLARDSRHLAKALRTVGRPEEMTLGVESLERRQRTARERLEVLLSSVAEGASDEEGRLSALAPGQGLRPQHAPAWPPRWAPRSHRAASAARAGIRLPELRHGPVGPVLCGDRPQGERVRAHRRHGAGPAAGTRHPPLGATVCRELARRPVRARAGDQRLRAAPREPVAWLQASSRDSSARSRHVGRA